MISRISFYTNRCISSPALINKRLIRKNYDYKSTPYINEVGSFAYLDTAYIPKTGDASKKDGSGSNSSDQNSEQEEKKHWYHNYKNTYAYWFLRRGLRSAQVVIIAGGIFTTGTSYGLTMYANDPHGVQEKLLQETIISNSNVTDMTDAYYDKNSEQYKRVSKVGDRIVKAARTYIDHKITHHQRILYDEMCVYNMSKTQFEDAAQDLLFWEKAYSRVDGDWKYIVIKEKEKVNAFTTESCPRHMFILEPFLTKLNPSDDELALVLAHELSHIILDHNSKQMMTKVMISALQLLLLTFIDPTGLSSFFLEGLSYLTTFAVSRRYDRNCETDADDLGVKLTTLACFDTVKAINFNLKLATEEKFRHTQLQDSHPSSSDRHHRLLDQTRLNRIQEGYKLCQRYRADLLYSIQHRKKKEQKEVFEWLGIEGL